MSISQKVDGVWTGVSVPWVKHNGTWKPAINVFAQDTGWKRVFAGDTTPPSPPVVSLSIVKEAQSQVFVAPVYQQVPTMVYVPYVPGKTTKKWISSKGGVPKYEYTSTTAVPAYYKQSGTHQELVQAGYWAPGPAPRTKHINVTVRMPQAAHDPSIRRIRVLVQTGDTYAPNPNAAGFFAQPDVEGGNESWSDFFFGDNGIGIDGNDFVSGRQTNLPVTKKFQPQWREGYFLPSNTIYRFTAWAQDVAGNWSQLSTNAYVSTAMTEQYTSAATLLPIGVGTITEPDVVASKVAGDAQVSATKSAYFDYGTQIRDIVPVGAVFWWATMRLTRKGADGGQPSARQYSAIVRANGTSYNGVSMDSVSGTNPISKGATVVKNLPIGDHALFRNDAAGIKLFAAADDQLNSQAVYASQADDPQQGAITLMWYHA